MNGTELIAKERARQIVEEGWTAEHDDTHAQGVLALAACCYAAPEKLFAKRNFAAGFQMQDPWPWPHEPGHDYRFQLGECKDNPGNVLPDPATYTDEERLELLIKAGALIVAEIELLQRRMEG